MWDGDEITGKDGSSGKGIDGSLGKGKDRSLFKGNDGTWGKGNDGWMMVNNQDGYSPMRAPGVDSMMRFSPYGQDVQLNKLGLPLRPGKEACIVYINSGMCGNGPSCIFDHPPDVAGGKGKLGAWQMPGLPGLPTGALSKASMPSLPTPGSLMPPPATYAPGAIAMQPDMTATPPLPLKNVSENDEKATEDNAVKKTEQEIEKKAEDRIENTTWQKAEDRIEEAPPEIEYNEDGLPIRPGTQKCGFYLKTGNCSYGPKCRFDHPVGLAGLMAGPGGIGSMPGGVGNGAITDTGMARRPGKDQCPFLARTGTCPFGSECRFDHSGSGEGAMTRQSESPALSS